MAAPKGKPRPAGAGRGKGTPNKATTNAREAIAEFVEGNVPRLNYLLDRIEREEGAKAAFDCIMHVVEYHIPKLQRTTLEGSKESPIVMWNLPKTSLDD